MDTKTTQDIVALIIVGLAAGTAASALMNRGKSSGRWIRNTIIGILGALIGNVIFKALEIEGDLPDFLRGEITPADVLVAFVGAIIIIFIARYIRD